MTENPFDPITLSKITNLELRAKIVVGGVLSGIHKSPYKGSSIEFLEHKEYSPGDEIKHIDWKVHARTDRYYIKQFEEETNLKCYLFLDTSGSMGYKSTGVTKLEYATTLASSLAYLLLKQSDAVGLINFSDRVLNYIPPRAHLNHLHILIDAMTGLKASGESNIAGVIGEFLEKIGRRSMVFVISDFFDNTDNIIRQLKYLQLKKNEIVLFHILDHNELTFPFDAVTFFESMEDDRRILVDPKHIREQYISALDRFIEQLKQSCLENQMDYWLIDSSTPLDQALIRFLAKRQRYPSISS